MCQRHDVGSLYLTADNCSGTDVAAGGTCTFGVIFTPTQTGVAVSKVVVSDDADITPQNITVVGEGKIVTPTVSPKVLPFGKVQVDTISAPQTVTLSNSNQVPVVFSSIAITSGPYEITSNSCGGSVAANSSCQVSVTFNPTSDTKPTGTEEAGRLTFTDNAQVPTQIATLTGLAIGTQPRQRNATSTGSLTPTDIDPQPVGHCDRNRNEYCDRHEYGDSDRHADPNTDPLPVGHRH